MNYGFVLAGVLLVLALIGWAVESQTTIPDRTCALCAGDDCRPIQCMNTHKVIDDLDCLATLEALLKSFVPISQANSTIHAGDAIVLHTTKDTVEALISTDHKLWAEAKRCWREP